MRNCTPNLVSIMFLISDENYTWPYDRFLFTAPHARIFLFQFRLIDFRSFSLITLASGRCHSIEYGNFVFFLQRTMDGEQIEMVNANLSQKYDIL